MNSSMPLFSSGFIALYCDERVFDSFSSFYPISFRRVLPFQAGEQVLDDPRLNGAEAAHLTDQNQVTRRSLVEEYLRSGLLEEADASHVNEAIDFFDTDFFELMGLLYANAGMHRCALRWYRERIRAVENPRSRVQCEDGGVHASIGYSLYSLGLFAEAIAWSKACMGPCPAADSICQALISYEAQFAGGRIRAVERAANRTRYTISGSLDQAQAAEAAARLQDAFQVFIPFQNIYMDWVAPDWPGPEMQPGYPFKFERDGSSLPRHKMNLLFATCGQADALIEQGYTAEAKQLLTEAAILEPNASMVVERLRELG